MASTNPGAQTEVTNYINSLEGFPKEICKSLRRIILNSSAELQEQWKWGPHYFCEGMVCGFGGFQNHAKLTFFNGSAMKDENKLFNHCVDNLFSRSIKFETIKELDEKMVIKYVRESIGVNKKGFKRIIANKTVIVPGDLESSLSKNKKAMKFFDSLSYGFKKEGVEWIESAKREETRKGRILKLVDMHANGLRMNDKYRKK